MMTADPSLVIGLDAGGTKTAAHARLGSREFTLTGPGTNVLRDGTDAAARTLAEIVREASGEAGGAAVSSVCAGVAGAGREPERSQLEFSLAASLGTDVTVRVVHDAHIALDAAWEGGSGAVLVVGTGSVLFGRTEEGEMVRAGGWGSRLGDDGSGTALGRAAVRATLAAFDGGPPTALTERFAESEDLHSAADVVHVVYEANRPLASFAPVLLAACEAGDWVAEQALMRETNALGQQAGWLATRVADTLTHRLALVGGLSGEPVYRAALTSALDRHLPGWAIEADPPPPVRGALWMAEALVAA
ncbi:BadF/BadG/BcrA/BcrD ATPase family protein [Rubricoccus marinus]|nr:BadF/BadG/BcrA/BcrD ATPase family protein [Rubricoccus marinus]